MRLEWLEDILAVHDAGSLRAAADLRLLTASAFTRRIKVVEEAIGAEIFDRSNKPVTLRPHVMELVPRMREIAAGIRQMRSELNGLGQDVQMARMICQHTLSVSWAPKVARRLASTGLQLRIRSGTKDECAFSVLKNDSDFALVYENPETEKTEEADLFDRIKLSTEQFLPVVASRGNLELGHDAQTEVIPIIVYPRNLFLGEALEQALTKRADPKVRMSTVAESGLGPAVLEFVREGLGVGWLPRSIVEKEIKNGALRPVTQLLPSFELEVVGIMAKANTSARAKKTWSSALDGMQDFAMT